MKKSFFLFLVTSLILSCGGPDDSPIPTQPNTIENGTDSGSNDNNDEPSGNETTKVSIELEGINNLDFGSLEAKTFSMDVPLGDNGEMAILDNQDEEGEPYLFIKDGELLFGYYRDKSDDKVTNLDLLF